MDLGINYYAAAAAAARAGEEDAALFAPELVPGGRVLNKVGVGGLGLCDAPVSLPEESLSDHEDDVALPGEAEVDTAENGGGGGALKCPVCERSFPSDKALYGHMRSHAGKGCKGANRPAAERKKASGTAALSVSWSVTAKRGRVLPKGIAGSSTSPRPRSSSSEEEAAWILVDMSMDCWVPEAQQPMLPEHSDDVLIVSDNDDSHQYTLNSNSEDGGTEKRQKRLEDLLPTAASEHTKPPPPPPPPRAASKNIKAPVPAAAREHTKPPSPPPPEGKNTKPRPRARIPSPASSRSFVCTKCYKTFSSHQALGGHKASHSKIKYSVHHHELALAHAFRTGLPYHHRHCVGAAGEYRVNPLMPRGPSTWKHVCTECYMRFPTGQALGGHKRRHWPGPGEEPPANAAAAAPLVELPTAPGAVELWNFDLNKIPRQY